MSQRGYSTGGGEAVAGGRPSLLIDLETVSERLHVDPRVLARKLRPADESRPQSPAHRTEHVFPSLSLQTLNDLIDGKSVILPGRETVSLEHSPAAAPGRYAQSHRMPPKTDRAGQEGWLAAGAAPRTPPPQHWRARRWWESRRDQKRRENAHYVRGVIVRASQPRREGEPPEAAGTPLLPGRQPPAPPPTPSERAAGRYEFSAQPPKGVVDNADVLPIRAVIMPIRSAESAQYPERLLAVPMPHEAEEPPPSTSAVRSGLLLSTRMRGRLPDEVREVAVRIEADDHAGDRVFLIVRFARPFVGWFALLVGVFGQAMQGPVIKMINTNSVGEPVSGFLLGAWNAQGLCILYSLWSVVTVLNGDFGAREQAYLFSTFGFAIVAASGVVSGLGSGAWTEAFGLTSVPQGYLFNSFHPTLIILWRMVLCKSVLCAEKAGIAVGLLGASLSMMDRGTAAGGAANIPLGDALAFCSSVSLCFYLLASKKVRPHLPLNVNLSVVTLFSALSQLALAAAFVPGGVTFGTDQNRGVFGFASATRWRPWMLLNGVGCVAQAGYIGALKYLNPVVVSICMTCEPVMATWIAYVILGESLDAQGVGIYTVLGGFAIILGSLVVSYYSRHHKEGLEIDVQADTKRAFDADGDECREWADFSLDHESKRRGSRTPCQAAICPDACTPPPTTSWKEA
eukprot:TRINITY_DN4209_c1_g1_i1.p1 TRINITY_DN4209_c1_g1~~TRINITY_DN4209_c1_g1_i1.p1  ORF type:complete len:683 (+),score=169.57 TRINITY_DN4209_c1_g1_i1:74-2122(+)